MIKRLGALFAVVLLLLSFGLISGPKARAATLPATLTTPAASTTYGMIPVQYTLGEDPLANSVRLIFTGTTTVTITLTIGSPTTGPYSYYINPTNILAAGAPITSTTSNTIPNGTYSVTLSYQDAGGDPAYVTAAKTNVVIDSSLIDKDFDGVTDLTEDAAPNSGDANDDGTGDSSQMNVISYVNSKTGDYAVLESTCDSIENFSLVNESISQPDTGYDYPFGLADFQTTCTSHGDTATIRQYYYGVEGDDIYTVRKFLPNGTYKTIPGYDLLGSPINGDIIFFVQYDITDGGEFDDDGTANGVVVDPSGAGVVTAAASNSSSASLASTGQSPLTLLILSIALLFMGGLGTILHLGKSFNK
jgi:hypothetical protein